MAENFPAFQNGGYMKINTKLFGEITINEEKLITFEKGIIGFPYMKRFLLIHDEEKSDSAISWLQSIEEEDFAMPVIDPLKVMEDYNPVVEDELLKELGELIPEETIVFVTITVPKEIEKMTVNLKAPIIINADNKKAEQLIIEDEKYVVKYPIYDILKRKKELKEC